jgi:HNH endonuclease
MPRQYRPQNLSAIETIEWYSDKHSECWKWNGAINKWGYGIVRWKGKTVLAHRLSWESHNFRDAGDLLICHKCDNPPCVNPNHLFIGTHQDNMRDRDEKGRGYDRSGIRNGRAKINSDEAETIRLRYWKGDNRKSLAEEFGIGLSQLQRIAKRINWR